MSRYQPTKLDWWILASLLVMTLIAACCGCSKAADRSESPTPNPFAMPADEKSIPSNSTGLEKPVKPSVLYASSNGKRWLIVTRELAVKRGSNRFWRVTLDANIGADWVINELQTDPFDGSAPMPSPMLGAESSYSWSATFDESQAKRLVDHKRESIRVDVNLVPRAGPSPDHEKAFEYLKSHPDAVKVDHIADAGKLVPVPPPQFQPPHDEPVKKPLTPPPALKKEAPNFNQPTRITFHLPKEILITGPDPCQACREAGRALERAKFRVKHDKKRADWNERYGGPVFHFVCPNGKWAFLPPSAWADGIQGLIQAIDAKMRENGAVDPVDNEFDEPAADQRVAAAGPGGSIKARAEVVRAFAFLRERVGENVPMQFRWARTGLQTFPVYGAPQNWSIEAICGKYGSVELSAPGCKLPVDHASVKYDVSGDKIGIETRIEFDLPNGTPKAGAKPVGFVDPASILTVFSVLRSVWAIFKTRVSLELGGDVSATATLVGNTLGIDFQSMPSVRIESLFNFHLAVRRVELTADKCRLLFSGSRFIKERTILLTD